MCVHTHVCVRVCGGRVGWKVGEGIAWHVKCTLGVPPMLAKLHAPDLPCSTAQHQQTKRPACLTEKHCASAGTKPSANARGVLLRYELFYCWQGMEQRPGGCSSLHLQPFQVCTQGKM